MAEPGDDSEVFECSIKDLSIVGFYTQFNADPSNIIHCILKMRPDGTPLHIRR